MSFCFWLCSNVNITWTQVTVWGYSEVISERQQLSSLVFEVVDKFGIFSILPCQSFLHTHTYIIYCIFAYVSISICEFNICWCSLKCVQKLHLQLKHRCVDGLCSMAFKATNDGVEDFLSDCHLLGVVVSSSLKEWVNHVSLYSTSSQNQNERQMEWQNYVVFKVIVLYAVMNKWIRVKTQFVLFNVVYALPIDWVCADFYVLCGTGISFIERKLAWKTVDVSVALGPNRSPSSLLDQIASIIR